MAIAPISVTVGRSHDGYETRQWAWRLALKPERYFSPGTNGPSTLVEVEFHGARRGYGRAFAFAVGRYCSAGSGSCGGPLLMRAVTEKNPNLGEANRTPFPRSREEMRRWLADHYEWREADIASCVGASAVLESLEGVDWFEFDPYDRFAMTGKDNPDDNANGILIHSGDSSTVSIKARSLDTDSAVVGSGTQNGSPGAWAVQMIQVAEPCLKATSLPPPWIGGNDLSHRK